MARKPRENAEDGIYHVYARGNAKAAVFRDDADRHVYLRLLQRTSARHDLYCLAYCLMSNHVHLLLETPRGNLSAGMQWFHGRYAQAFNGRHGRSGHVFQGRYGAVRMKSDAQLQAAAVYIARNPVEAGICAEAEDWPWSSFRALVIGGPTPSHPARLFGRLGNEPTAARRSYLEAVRSAINVSEEPVASSPHARPS